MCVCTYFESHFIELTHAHGCVSCGGLASAGKSRIHQDNACALTHPTQNGRCWQSRSSLLCQTRKCLLQWLFVQSEDSQTPSPRHVGYSTADFPHQSLVHISSISLFLSNTNHLGCQTIAQSIQRTPMYICTHTHTHTGHSIHDK